MPRARNIKPGIMENEELAELSAFARLLFIYLWMLADCEGRLEDRPRRIKAQAFPYDELDCDSLLNELHQKGFIIRYKVGLENYIQITKFVKHQYVSSKEKEGGSIIPPYNPNDTDLDIVSDEYHTGIKPVSNQNQTSIKPASNRFALNTEVLNTDKLNTEPPIVPQKGDECKNAFSDSHKSKTPVKESLTTGKSTPKPHIEIVRERFELFWKSYPRKIGKDAAFKAFQKRVTTNAELEAILEALDWQKDSSDWLKDGGQYIPHPTTYLNQGRWKDEIDTETEENGEYTPSPEFRKMQEDIRAGRVLE